MRSSTKRKVQVAITCVAGVMALASAGLAWDSGHSGGALCRCRRHGMCHGIDDSVAARTMKDFVSSVEMVKRSRTRQCE